MVDCAREAFLNIARRKARSILAILGIGAGIFVLIVIGSMSEYFRSLSTHFSHTYRGKLFLCEKMSFWAGSGIISEEKVPLIKSMEGIGDAVPLLIGRLDPEELFTLGMPSVIVGLPPGKAGLYMSDPPLLKGRWLLPDDKEGAILGFDVAQRCGLSPGGTIMVREHPFPVLGVLKKTGSLEDRQVIAPLEEVQRALLRPHLITCIIALPEKGRNAEALAAKIRASLPWILTASSKEIDREVARNVVYWETLTLICAIISALASFLSLAVIMVLAVSERKREIGLKKALGAEDGHIVVEFVTETLLMCGLGWCVGFLAGEAFIACYSSALAARGISLFLVTPGLIIFSLLWSLSVGLVSGILPALGAAGIEPIKAFRQV
jgi:putative ABC transport system permease protein